MTIQKILPLLENGDQYRKIFREDEAWLPAILFLQKKYGLSGEPRRSPYGSHIVYRLGDVWLKLIAPLFPNEMKYELSGLKSIADQLNVDHPRVLFEGELEGWRYVGLSHVEGEALRTIWPKLNMDSKVKIVSEMAEVILQLRKCAPQPEVQERFQWNDFIKEQYEKIEELQKKKELPPPWLSEVKSFLRRFDLSVFQTLHPVFLHCDLTFEHFLIEVTPEVHIQGIIDLADCQTGHPDYELLAPLVFVLRGEKDLLRFFLLKCGYAEKDLNQEFSEKLMVWTLLHRYCVIKHLLKTEMDLCTPGDFKQLAAKIFPLE